MEISTRQERVLKIHTLFMKSPPDRPILQPYRRLFLKGV